MEWEDDGSAGGRAIDAAVARHAAEAGTLSGGDDDAAAAAKKAAAAGGSSWFGGSSSKGGADKEAASKDVYALLKSPKSAARLNTAAWVASVPLIRRMFT